MRVRVYVPPLADASAVDDRGFMELPEGSTLNTLLKRLRVPFRLGYAMMCLVNYERADLRRPLSDGDTVSFFSILPGG